MLQVFVRNSAADAKRYYNTDLSVADYPVRDWSVENAWGGKAAEMLGLAGPVQRAEFERLCDNRRPDTGDGLTPRTKAFRRVGYDLVFDCPKSLSILYALTGDERIISAFREAVQETMLQVQAAAQTRVRRLGVNSDRTTGNLVWASFFHLTTRPVDGVPDPHLHAHVFVFNATHDPVEERWKALQLGGIYRDAPFHEATFHSVIAGKMMQLGYPVAADGRFWRIESVPRSVVEKFSGRSAEIKRESERLGIRSPERKADLGRQTRHEKSSARTWSELHRIWEDRLTAAERSAVRDAWRTSQPEEPPMTARRALEMAHKECFDRSGLVLENKLLESALRFGVGRVTLDALRDELPRLAILKRGRPGQLYFMDEARLRDERESLAFVRDGRGTCRPFGTDRSTLAGADAKAVPPLRTLLQSTDGISVLKSSDEIRGSALSALSKLGHPVRVLHAMPGAIVDPPPGSNAFEKPPPDTPSKRAVWWVDHSQRLGFPQLVKLLRDADEQNARVVLAVDPGRLSRNSPIRLLRSHAGAAIRGTPGAKEQFNERRKAFRAWKSGRGGDALNALDHLGGVREVDASELPKAVADYYVASQRKSTKTWVVANSEQLATQITRAIRDLLVEMKKLGRPRRFIRLDPVPMHDARKALRKGNVLVFSKPVRGFKPGQRYTIAFRDMLGNAWVRDGLKLKQVPLMHFDRFSVFRPSEIELAKGDLIRITARGKTLNEPFHLDQLRSKRTRYRNAQIAKAFGLPQPSGPYRVEPDAVHRIVGFTLRGHVKLENGWILSKDFGHWTHGYAVPEVANQDMKTGGVLCAMQHTRDGRGHRLEGLFTNNLEKLKAEVSGRSDDDVPTGRGERANGRERNYSRGFDYGR